MMAPSTMILFKLGLVNLINLIMRREGGEKEGGFQDTHSVYTTKRMQCIANCFSVISSELNLLTFHTHTTQHSDRMFGNVY